MEQEEEMKQEEMRRRWGRWRRNRKKQQQPSPIQMKRNFTRKSPQPLNKRKEENNRIQSIRAHSTHVRVGIIL